MAGAIFLSLIRRMLKLSPQPVLPLPRPTHTAREDDRDQNERGDEKANARKRERRQIGQTELDKKPGRAPNAAKD